MPPGPARSSKGHFVKTSGLRWLAAMLIIPVPWAEEAWVPGLRSRSGKPPQGERLMALPVLTALVPSERFYASVPRAPKALLDAARQMILQIGFPREIGASPIRTFQDRNRLASRSIDFRGCPHRWLPGRRIVVVADSAFAAIAFLAALKPHACVVTRLRLDANLFAPAPPRTKSTRGRPPLKGKRLPKLTEVLDDAATVWTPHRVALWYGKADRAIETTTGTAVWYHGGLPPPQASPPCCTGPGAQACSARADPLDDRP